MAATTFPQFSRLPAELRNQIWQGALPDRIEPAICFYKKGCWLPREVAPSDEDYNPDPDGNLYFEFRHDLLDALQLEIPLYFVNHDARSIALGWICKHNVDIRKFQDTPAPVFTCPFKPIRDVLYAAPDTWDDFTREPNDRRFQQDLLDRHLLSGRMELEYIAIPAVWLRDDDAIKTLVDTLVNKNPFISLLRARSGLIHVTSTEALVLFSTSAVNRH